MMNSRRVFLLTLFYAIGLPLCLSAQPLLLVDPLEINHPEGQELSEHIINLFNDGDARLTYRLEIDFGMDDDDWLIVEPRVSAIPVGMDLDLLALMDFRGKLSGVYNADIHILSNDPAHPDIPVHARGVVPSRPAIQAQWSEQLGYPEVIDWNQAFNPLYILRSYVVRIDLLNAGNDVLQVNRISCPHRFWTPSPAVINILPGNRREIAITFLNDNNPGLQESELVITSNAIEHNELRIPLRAEASPPPAFIIRLAPGWNMISAPVSPRERYVPILFRPLVRNESLVLVKDACGRFFFPGWNFCNFLGWDDTQGYQVLVSRADSLGIAGLPIEADEPIPLRRGWNMIAYYPQADIRAPVAFRNISQELIIAKDAWGHFYRPEFDFNNMEPLEQGRGYQVKVNGACELQWPTAVPASLEMEIGNEGEDAGGGAWAVPVTVRVLDDGGNLLAGMTGLEFAVEPDFGVIQNVAAQDGLAETTLIYNSINTFREVVVTAAAIGFDGLIQTSLDYLLPLQGGELFLRADPANWFFDRDRPNDPCNIRLWTVLRDAHNILILRGHAEFEISRGQLVNIQPQSATLRGTMGDFFLDPFTLEVIVQAQARMVEDEDVESNIVIIRMNRE